MLTRLYIANYVLIDRLEIDFYGGLTTITGETGAGKSILLGALSLILGERADTKAMRDPAQKTIVEATIDIAGYDLNEMLDSADVDHDTDECILRREIAPSGRSRAFVNDTPVSLAFLRDVATRLVDIHSQHSNMLLADRQFQLSILDSLADNHELRQSYAEVYQMLVDTRRKLDDASQRYDKARAEEDYLRFQLDQLQALKLQPAEDTQLEQEQQRLSNITDIKQRLWQVDDMLNNEQLSVIQHMKDVTGNLQAVEHLVPQLQGLSERATSALIDIKDIAATVADAMEQLQLDPERLDYIESRLNDIYTLERKHQVDTVDQLIGIMNDYDNRLNAIDNDEQQLQQLRQQVAQYEQQAAHIARQLTATRQHAAQAFARQLVDKAHALALNNLRFEVDFSTTELTSTGHDVVDFGMAFNKSQPLMPVKDTVSGGEISRVMLCIKAIIAQHVSLPTIILDEIDTGVSGDTASRMGEMMDDIARNIQVIAITHLPQVAAHGQQHLKVYKSDDNDATNTYVAVLDDEQYVMEVARMLSGRDINQAAIDNARTLISQNSRL